jgi:hypothetical protein
MHHDKEVCKGEWNDVNAKIALAETANPVLDGDDKPTQIQLCPWFVDWIKNKNIRLGNDVARSNIGRLFIKLSESTRFGFTQIGKHWSPDEVEDS